MILGKIGIIFLKGGLSFGGWPKTKVLTLLRLVVQNIDYCLRRACLIVMMAMWRRAIFFREPTRTKNRSFRSNLNPGLARYGPRGKITAVLSFLAKKNGNLDGADF
jgi:hypothetical protein